tara:strand:- start:7008 stop:8564 length:1557 start_codon:yes stop_codon:yes gene_type:complete
MDDELLLKIAAAVGTLKKQVGTISNKTETITKLQGPQGDKGDKGVQGVQGPKGDRSSDGVSGLPGEDGKDGVDGEDGVSVTDAYIAADGNLVIVLSDGNEVDVGEISSKGADNNAYVLKQGSDFLERFGPAIGTMSAFTYVSSKEDLPSAVANVITLNADHTYYFIGTVDLLGCRLVGGFNTCILGPSSENASITSTGLGVGVALFTTAWTTPVRHVTFKDVDTCLDISGATNAPVALDWTGVNFTNIPNVGVIDTCDNFIFSKGSFLGSEGLRFTGSVGTFSITESLLRGSGGAGSLIEVDASATVTRRFRITYSSVIAFGSTTGIDVNASATLPIEGFILDTVSFTGGSTYLPGLSTASNFSLFSECKGIVNTSVNGQAYMRNNTTATTISATNTFYKVEGTTTASSDNAKYDHANNRLTNAAEIDRKYVIHCTLSFLAGTNDVCEFGFYDSKLAAVREPSKTAGTANASGRMESLSLSCIVQHSFGDYLEIHCANTSGTTNITVESMNLLINEIK